MTNTDSPLLVNKKRIYPHVGAKTNQSVKAWRSDYETSTVDCENLKKPTQETLIEQAETEIFDLENGLNNSTRLRHIETKNKTSKKFLFCGKKFTCLWRFPWVVFVNSVIQIFMYVFMSERIFNLLLYSPHKKYEIWRFLSYTLLHSDTLHLSLNILLQFLAAFFLETEQSHWKVLLIYLTGGFAGATGTYIFQPKLLMVGSSAGVYSLLISHVPHLIMNFHCLRYKYFRIIALLFLCSSDAGYTLVQMYLGKNLITPISTAAHLSGIYNGLLLGFVVFSRPKLGLFQLSRYACLILYIISITLAVIVAFKCDSNTLYRGCLKAL